MMVELNEIETKYFDLTEDKISADEFEQWVYQSKSLENELDKNEYLDLISLDFRTSSAKYEIEKILKDKVNKGKFETLKLLNFLEDIIERKGEEVKALAKMYDLYCDGYDFLQDLGLGIGLEIEVPYRWGVNHYHELSDKQKDELVGEFYPVAKEMAEQVKNWIIDEKLILTGEVDSDLNTWEYIDKRSEEDKKSKVWKTFVDDGEMEIKQNLIPDQNSDFTDEPTIKKSWWQKLFGH